MGERIKLRIGTKWRPMGWDNPYSKLDDYYRENQMAEQAFEEGGQTILNLLWKMAEESPTKEFSFDANDYEG